ncbi:MAG: ATP-binding protein [Candidatus Woesearchaeota archaeon]
MIWYEKFNYKSNPLSIKPKAEFELFFDDKSLVNDIIKNIEDNQNILLKGAFGTGKTSILKKIIAEFGGKKKLFYYNAYSNNKPLNYDEVLKNAGNPISKFFMVKSKDVILFIDEAHNLSSDNLEGVIPLLNTNFKSVILSSSKQDFVLPEVLNNNVKIKINLENFTQKDAFNIVKDRLGENQSILSDEEILDVYNKSYTPRDFLLSLEDYCKNKF